MPLCAPSSNSVQPSSSSASPFLAATASSSTPPCTLLLSVCIIKNGASDSAPDTGNINSLTEVAYATVDFEFPLQNWVHIGCEVCPNHMKLQINGEIVGEKSLSSNKEPSSNDLRKIVLANIGGDGNISHGYVYNFQVFPSVSSIKDHHMKEPPLKLSIDESSASEIEEESDGVWSIVGGKVWYPSPGANSFKQEDFLQLDPELEFDREVYPLGLLPNAGVVVGVSQRISFSAGSEFPCFEPSPQAQTILHCLLHHLLQRDKIEEALRLEDLSAENPHFSHCLEWLPFTVFEADISSFAAKISGCTRSSSC